MGGCLRVCLRVCVCVCERVCVITKPERFWVRQHINYSLVSFSVRNTMCGGRAAGQKTEISDCHNLRVTLESL